MPRNKKPRSSGQHHGDLKRSLLAMATKMVEAGNVDFSLRELSTKTGVTAAAPYHHFASKTAVLNEIAADGFHQLEQALTAAMNATQVPEEQLSELVLAYLRFSGEHLAHYQLMFPPRLGVAKEYDALRPVAEAAFARLVDAVRRVRTDASEEDLSFWALCIWALCHGFLSLQKDGLLLDDGAFGAIEKLRPRIAALSVRLLGENGGRT